MIIKNSLSQDTLPNVDDSLDAVASVSGNFSAILSGITPTVDQLKAMLQQLQTSLDDSVNALTKTGEALEKVDAQLASTATDVQALQSSEAYRQISLWKALMQKLFRTLCPHRFPSPQKYCMM